MIRKPLIMSFLCHCTESLAFLDNTKQEQKHSESLIDREGNVLLMLILYQKDVMETFGFYP